MVLLHHSLNHLEQSKMVLHFTYALNHVHVVVFFIIAGLLFEKQRQKVHCNTFGQFFLSKWKRLMIPYLFWFILIAAIINLMFFFPFLKNMLINMGYSQWNLKSFIWNTLTMQDFYVMHLWFIYVLFIIYIINYVGKDIISDWKVFMVLFLGLALLKSTFSLPLLLDRVCIYLVDFVFGRMLSRYRNMQCLYLNARLVFLSIIIIITLLYMEYTCSNSLSYTYIGNFIWGIAGTQIIMIVSEKINQNLKKLAEIMVQIGDKSYGIYLMHNPYIIVPCFIIMQKLSWQIPRFIQLIISVILSIVIPIRVERVLKKAPILHKITLGD